MAIEQRLELYRQLEAKRGRPLFAYVTSSRQNATGGMAADAVAEITDQLQALPPEARSLDLLIVSHGGDPTVAWRIVSLIRERVDTFSVLIPQAAFSAATLIALGADEIVMHPHGNLGPVDPQIIVPRQDKQGKPTEPVSFGSEDLNAFLEFARDSVGLTDQSELLSVFQKFLDEVGAVPVGKAARGSQLAISLSKRLLTQYMFAKDGEQRQAETIAEQLNKRYFHHGHAVGRSEARDLGLKIAEPNADVEETMWRIWLDFENELQMRNPFNPLGLVKNNPDCKAMFEPVPQLTIPENLTPEAKQNILNQFLQQSIVHIPSTPYEQTNAAVESPRHSSRCVSEGLIFAARQANMEIKMSVAPTFSGWRKVTQPTIGEPKLPEREVAVVDTMDVVGAKKKEKAK